MIRRYQKPVQKGRWHNKLFVTRIKCDCKVSGVLLNDGSRAKPFMPYGHSYNIDYTCTFPLCCQICNGSFFLADALLVLLNLPVSQYFQLGI